MKIFVAQKIRKRKSEDVLPIYNRKIEHAMKRMKNNKISGEVQIRIEMLKADVEMVQNRLKISLIRVKTEKKLINK